ncbi:hypothetical protein ACFOYU_24500 [Microvirga sp. GCM10011540]|uniref:hypothetical protein n=1 Tax=Microvirga sp. GCM10011540 TaxID=3317338 RepID=UPI00361D555E
MFSFAGFSSEPFLPSFLNTLLSSQIVSSATEKSVILSGFFFLFGLVSNTKMSWPAPPVSTSLPSLP